jgi:SSS family solute:Na+ symporter
MFLPKTDNILPWTALLVGLWIPNFYYWGLNQYITQRTLGSASLSQGQKGIVFASFLKLLIPFVIVVPGIIAFNLFSKDMRLDAVGDNARTMAKYYKANPATELVDVITMPTEDVIANWEPGRFLIALYDNDEAQKAVSVQNSYVLPLIKSEYNEITPAEYTVFQSEDKAWQHVFPTLAEEIQAFNKKTRQQAVAMNAQTTTEKFIAYKYDTAMGHLIGSVLPQGVGLVGLVLAALLGAVVSSLAAMLNASSTIFTMDIIKKYIVPDASQKLMVLFGRICVVIFSFIAVILAPQLGNPKISNSIFTIIQEGQGFISPGILAIFAFGLLIRRAPKMAGVVGLLTNIVAYGLLKVALPDLQFLNRMAICFGLCIVVMTIMTFVKPLAEPVVFKQQSSLNLKSSKGALIAGIIVIVLTLVLYLIFSPIGIS